MFPSSSHGSGILRFPGFRKVKQCIEQREGHLRLFISCWLHLKPKGEGTNKIEENHLLGFSLFWRKTSVLASQHHFPFLSGTFWDFQIWQKSLESHSHVGEEASSLTRPPKPPPGSFCSLYCLSRWWRKALRRMKKEGQLRRLGKRNGLCHHSEPMWRGQPEKGLTAGNVIMNPEMALTAVPCMPPFGD